MIKTMFRSIILNKHVQLVLAGMVLILLMCTKNDFLNVEIVSFPDSQASFKTSDVVLEQTWAPYAK